MSLLANIITAAFMLLGLLGIIAAAAIWLANADVAVEVEAERIAADNDWRDPAIERFRQQLADDNLIRHVEQWGESV